MLPRVLPRILPLDASVSEEPAGERDLSDVEFGESPALAGGEQLFANGRAARGAREKQAADGERHGGEGAFANSGSGDGRDVGFESADAGLECGGEFLTHFGGRGGNFGEHGG